MSDETTATNGNGKKREMVRSKLQRLMTARASIVGCMETLGKKGNADISLPKGLPGALKEALDVVNKQLQSEIK